MWFGVTQAEGFNATLAPLAASRTPVWPSKTDACLSECPFSFVFVCVCAALSPGASLLAAYCLPPFHSLCPPLQAYPLSTAHGNKMKRTLPFPIPARNDNNNKKMACFYLTKALEGRVRLCGTIEVRRWFCCDVHNFETKER